MFFWDSLAFSMIQRKLAIQSLAPLPFKKLILYILKYFPGSSDGKVSAYNAGDLGLIPELGRSPGEGNGDLLQYSCLGKPMDRGA